MMMSAVAAALAIGATGREGISIGLLYAVLAWLLAGGVFALLARRGRAG